MFGFYSKLVRLEVIHSISEQKWIIRFYSKLVRLEEMLIEERLHFDIDMFLFQTGAIRSKDAATANVWKGSFYSKLVRLEV